MTDPGVQVDVELTVRLYTMTRYWLGQIAWRDVAGGKEVSLEGPQWVRRSPPRWLDRASFAGVPRP